MMGEILKILFSPMPSYLPHGHCYLWQTPLVSLHVASDSLIALAYFSIPTLLLYFVFSRQNVPFQKIFILFGTFIILCGVGHLLDIWTLWYPHYWVTGIEQALTALVSCYTAASMVTLIPQFLTLKSPEELEKINQKLHAEIQLRLQMEEALRWANETLEKRVQERTLELEMINQTLASEIESRQLIETALRESEGKEREKAQNLHDTLQKLKHTQSQLVQAGKMAALGKMVAVIAHEINNPITFIYGNIQYVREYSEDLLELIHEYRQCYPQDEEKIARKIELIDLDFIQKDLLKMLDSMGAGANRIKNIVLCLRNFSHLDQSDLKMIDLNENIHNLLDLIASRFCQNGKSIEVVSQLGDLPKIECYPRQLNQAILSLLENGIDGIMERWDKEAEFCGKVAIATTVVPKTEVQETRVTITISDNGIGIPEPIMSQIFDPFFTTKPVGRGTGLGLANTYQIIVQQHQGKLHCHSIPQVETVFTLELPLSQAIRDEPTN